MWVKIKAIFKGENLSLGYITGKPYNLLLKSSTIKLSDGTGKCEYSSLESFFKNWKITAN
jgi:hypothetical protein